ncbi:hypothetical protein Q5762_17365 [Streptomyces sp. P9(2023)]|uniref:hypothetical protein n=1 Tax=Streptomyces sp. P9(2023) TaxID=3064394 RepID=UPI0028F43CC2|nr:hypothetical protein [Streptomyces sp. P9(2023)]MDT9690073.1 hypothetical protein [Streptomyces sp. P9(2023)]
MNDPGNQNGGGAGGGQGQRRQQGAQGAQGQREPQRGQQREPQRGRGQQQGRQGQQGRPGQQGQAGRQGAAGQRGEAGQPGMERAIGPLIGEVAPPYRRTSGTVAAVLLYRNGGHRIMWPDRTEDTNKPRLSSPYTVFEVLTGRHVTEFELSLPASGDGIFFKAAARVVWEVADPYLVVTHQVWDVAELLRHDLLDGLRAVSRRFRLTDAQRADEAVREELSSGRFSLGEDLGLLTRVLVFIDLDDTIKEEIGKRDMVGVSMQVDEREMEQRRVKELAERRLVAERARDLEELFRRGDLAQIAHHMAMNPDKQWDIRRELQHEKREGQADFLAVFNRLLDTGVLERHDIGEPMYQVLEFLRESTGTVLGGVAGQVLNPPGRARGRAALDSARAEPVLPPWHDDTGDEEEPAEAGRDAVDRERAGRDAADRERADGERADGERADRDGAGRDRVERDEGRTVYEPTRVQSSSERDRDERARRRYRDFDDRRDDDGRHDDRRYDDREDGRDDDRDFDRGYDDRRRDDRDRGRPPRRPSAEFDDWDTE